MPQVTVELNWLDMICESLTLQIQNVVRIPDNEIIPSELSGTVID
jgi:DNA-binding Xre family transcriptional regulator